VDGGEGGPTLPSMPVPLPDERSVLLVAPDAEEAALMGRGIAWAASPTGGLADLQRFLLEALFTAMTGYDIDLSTVEPISAHDYALGLARRNLAFRSRMVQVMLLAALLLRPLPSEVVARVSEFSAELGVDESMIAVARDFAAGSLGLAAFDFDRNGYTSTWHPEEAAAVLHTSRQLEGAWDVSVTDAELAARWEALGHLPPGSLGRGVFELYCARGFMFPGTPGSAPPLLAQHDWVHVLADYGTTVEAELEVFAFIARANDDMRAFSLLAMVISLFETGYLRSGAGLFESSPGHISGNRDVARRLSDAMRRGALCHDKVTNSDSIDFLQIDWFSVADLPIGEVRDRFSVPEKSLVALTAGSVGPCEPGGISPFQLNAGKELAAARGEPYDSYGASC